MTVKINGGAVGTLALHYFNQNVNSLSKSVEKLSSGLRINRSADDPATSSIARKLNNQALSLGQAVRNANDAVSVMQIVDGALSETIDILNLIRTKAVQGAQDSMTSDARSALQLDINTLLEELDLIVETADYNGQNLLTGSFLNKQFQIGAYANEEVAVSFSSAKESVIGRLGMGEVTLTSSYGGLVNFSFINPDTDETLSVSSMSIRYANDAQQGMGGVADYINRFTSDTGISAIAVVQSTSEAALSAGGTLDTFAINDVTIGAVTVQDLDANNKLINAINAQTSNHGVTASLTSSGQLFLDSQDGRAIKVVGAGTIGATDDELTTLGAITVLQSGPYKLNLSDLGEGVSVAFSSNMTISADVLTTIDSILATGSVLGNGTSLTAGWTAGAELTGADLDGVISTSQSSTLFVGSVLADGSIISAGSTLGGTATTASAITSEGNSILQSGSVLKAGSVIAQGSYLTNDITTASGTISAQTVLSEDATLTADLFLSVPMLLLDGSSLASGSDFSAGSAIGGDITLSGSMALDQEMTLLSDSTIANDGTTVLSAGSTIGGSAAIVSSKTLTQEMTVSTGSTLSNQTQFALGSTIGGPAVLNGDHTTVLDVLVESGSILASNSQISSGTLVTSVLQTASGAVAASTTLTAAVLTEGENILSSSMLLRTGSIVANGSTLAANSQNDAGVQATDVSVLRLINLNVLTAYDATIAIAIADEALKDLEQIRAGAGAYQSRFESSISYLGETQMNVLDARSKMIDVDFASEIENLTKMQLLVQSSAFSLTQANAVPQNVFRILQGGTSQDDFFIAATNQSISSN